MYATVLETETAFKSTSKKKKYKYAKFPERVSNNVNSFQPSVGFHIKTSDLICSANQMTGFYMK